MNSLGEQLEGNVTNRPCGDGWKRETEPTTAPVPTPRLFFWSFKHNLTVKSLLGAKKNVLLIPECTALLRRSR